MPSINPIKKQKFTLNEKYKHLLATSPKAISRLSNSNNLLDDLNSKDKQLIREVRTLLRGKKPNPTPLG